MNSTVKIRPAAEDDSKIILELNKKAIPHVSELPPVLLDWFRKHSRFLMVAEDENGCAGFMIVLGPGKEYSSLNYRYFEANYDDFDYVDRIVVAETHRRAGIGTALYAELFKKSRAACITCEVNIKPPNPVSVQFHEQLGFSEAAQQDTEEGRKRVSLMVKPLR